VAIYSRLVPPEEAAYKYSLVRDRMEKRPDPKAEAEAAAAAELKAKNERIVRDMAKYRAWPGHPEDLLFVWENGKAKNEVRTPSGRLVRRCKVARQGGARLSYYYSNMYFTEDGHFVAAGADRAILNACKSSNALSIEAWVTPSNVEQSGPKRIVSFSSSGSSRNFTLGQDRNRLVLRLRTPETGTNGATPQVYLCKVEEDKAHHVVVTYTPGKLRWYLNGKLAGESEEIQGDFSNWSAQKLIFGDEHGGHRDWSGLLDGVAIYSRVIPPQEVARKFALYLPKIKDRPGAKHLNAP
jgi:hypothetical protein